MIKHVKVFCDEYRLTLNPDGKFTVITERAELPSSVLIGSVELESTDRLVISQDGIGATVEAGVFSASSEIIISNQSYASELLSGVLVNPDKINNVPTMGVMQTYVAGQISEYGGIQSPIDKAVIQSPLGESVLTMHDSSETGDEMVVVDFTNGASASIGPVVSSISGLIIQATSTGVQLLNQGGVTVSPALRLDYTSDVIHEISPSDDSVAMYAMSTGLDTNIFTVSSGDRYELTSSQRALAFSLLF